MAAARDMALASTIGLTDRRVPGRALTMLAFISCVPSSSCTGATWGPQAWSRRWRGPALRASLRIKERRRWRLDPHQSFHWFHGASGESRDDRGCLGPPVHGDGAKFCRFDACLAGDVSSTLPNVHLLRRKARPRARHSWRRNSGFGLRDPGRGGLSDAHDAPDTDGDFRCHAAR